MGGCVECAADDDLVLMSVTIEGLVNKFRQLKEAFESMGLKVNLGKTKVIVAGGFTTDVLSKIKVYPCEVCSLIVNMKSVLCVQCGKLIHGICGRLKSATQMKFCLQEMWLDIGVIGAGRRVV